MRRRPRLALLACLALALPRSAAAAKPPTLPLVAAGSTPVGGLSEADAFRATVQPHSNGRRIGQVLGVSVEWDRVSGGPRWRWRPFWASAERALSTPPSLKGLDGAYERLTRRH
jgi:hypothetical protein